MRKSAPVLALLLALWPASAQLTSQKLPRAIVVDLANTARDTHLTLIPTATDALAVGLARAGVYDVVSRKELDRAAADHRLKPPYSDLDLSTLAREVGASAIVSGEVRFIEVHGREPNKQIEVGVLVRVREAATRELIGGAAERGTATVPADGSKTDTMVLLDAGIAAADRCADRVAEYRPIVGTVLNNQSRELVVINKGLGDGVKKNQEFVAYRSGTMVARLRMFKPFGRYTLLKVTESLMGVQPEDRVIAVFAEPKFAR